MEATHTHPHAYIELIGLPGSGKTSLTKEVVTHLRSQGWSCKTRASVFEEKESALVRFGGGLWFVLRHPLVTGRLFSFCVRSRIRTKYFPLLGVFISQERAVHSRPDFVLYDQGAINTLLSLQEKSLNWAAISDLYHALLPTNIRLVFIQTDPTTAEQRARSRPPRGHFTETESSETIQLKFEHYLTGVENLRRTGLFQIDTLDGHRSVTENSQNLLTLLKDYV